MANRLHDVWRSQVHASHLMCQQHKPGSLRPPIARTCYRRTCGCQSSARNFLQLWYLTPPLLRLPWETISRSDQHSDHFELPKVADIQIRPQRKSVGQCTVGLPAPFETRVRRDRVPTRGCSTSLALTNSQMTFQALPLLTTSDEHIAIRHLEQQACHEYTLLH